VHARMASDGMPRMQGARSCSRLAVIGLTSTCTLTPSGRLPSPNSRLTVAWLHRGVAKLPAGLPLPLDTCRQVFGRGVRAGMYPINTSECYWFTCFNAPEVCALGLYATLFRAAAQIQHCHVPQLACCLYEACACRPVAHACLLHCPHCTSKPRAAGAHTPVSCWVCAWRESVLHVHCGPVAGLSALYCCSRRSTVKTLMLRRMFRLNVLALDY
jgi:hypothetical protein